MNTENTHEEQSTLGSREADPIDPLDKALRRIRRTKDFPTVSKYVMEINQKLSDHSIHSSASELANIILKDYALTNKLLKLVNSAFYGFVAGKVTTVTRAVVLLGYDNVRLAAISLVLFEHFKSKSAVRDLKDATISSFWCALLAKEIARMQYMIDPEEAFICALLHKLGKLLTIYHMPSEFREIKYRVTQRSAKEVNAVKQVLGISYKALGIAVAKQWNFPERILETMAQLTSEQLEDKTKRLNPLCALTNFADALCRIIEQVRLDRRDAAIENLLDRYSGYVTISFKQLKTVMALCLEGLYKYSDALQFSLDQSEFLMLLFGRNPDGKKKKTGDPGLIGHAGPKPGEAAGAYRLSDGNQFGPAATATEGNDVGSIIMAGIQELNAVMLGAHEINDIALLSLEIIYRALACNRAILFVSESRDKSVAARFGYGAGVQRIVGKVRFDINQPDCKDLFIQSIQSGRDLIVEDAHAPELHPLIPEWYRKYIDAKAFIFMPVVFQDICIGAYYADLDHAGSLISDLDHKYLSMLRNQLILAIKMGR